MGILLAYSLKSAVILTILFLAYMLLLQRVKGATLRRTTLIAIGITVLLLPCLDLNTPITNNIHTSPSKGGPEESALGVILGDPSNVYRLYSWLSIVFIAGMIITAAHTALAFFKMWRLRRRCESLYQDGIHIYLINDDSISPFCFAGRIFISRKDYVEKGEMILLHERSHIAHRHFIDLMIGRLIIIIQWWNPLAWLMLREMKIVHEYQADADVITAGVDPVTYQYMLLKIASGRQVMTLGNGIGCTKLKDRLRMINSQPTGRKSTLRLLPFIPILIATFYLLSTPLFASVIQPAKEATLSDLANHTFVINTSENTDDKTGEPEVMIEGKTVDYSTLKNLDPANIESITVRKNNPEYPNGLIEIKLKPNTSTSQQQITSPTTLRIDSVGMKRKY